MGRHGLEDPGDGAQTTPSAASGSIQPYWAILEASGEGSWAA